jgi:hypothetical protein
MGRAAGKGFSFLLVRNEAEFPNDIVTTLNTNNDWGRTGGRPEKQTGMPDQ